LNEVNGKWTTATVVSEGIFGSVGALSIGAAIILGGPVVSYVTFATFSFLASGVCDYSRRLYTENAMIAIEMMREQSDMISEFEALKKKSEVLINVKQEQLMTSKKMEVLEYIRELQNEVLALRRENEKVKKVCGIDNVLKS